MPQQNVRAHFRTVLQANPPPPAFLTQLTKSYNCFVCGEKNTSLYILFPLLYLYRQNKTAARKSLAGKEIRRTPSGANLGARISTDRHDHTCRGTVHQSQPASTAEDLKSARPFRHFSSGNGRVRGVLNNWNKR